MSTDRMKLLCEPLCFLCEPQCNYLLHRVALTLEFHELLKVTNA